MVAIKQAVQNVEDEFVRLFFLKSHTLEQDGVKLAHQVGKYYHVSKAAAEQLIADGVAQLDTVKEALDKKAEADRAAAAAEQVQTPAGTVSHEGQEGSTTATTDFVSPAPAVVEVGEGGK